MKQTFLALALLGLPLAAHAQLSITLTPSTLVASVGSTVTFVGTIQNTSGAELFLNDLSFSGDTELSLDKNVFFFNVPGVLDPVGSSAFDTYTGDLFGISVDSAALPAFYSGTVTFLGGADSSATSVIGTTLVTVTTAPEPGTLALLAVGGGFLARRRRLA